MISLPCRLYTVHQTVCMVSVLISLKFKAVCFFFVPLAKYNLMDPILLLSIFVTGLMV